MFSSKVIIQPSVVLCISTSASIIIITNKIYGFYEFHAGDGGKNKKSYFKTYTQDKKAKKELAMYFSY